MKPKILIDASPLLSEKTGIGRYIYENSSIILNINKRFDIYFHYGFNSKKLHSNTTGIKRDKFLSLLKIKKLLAKNNLLYKASKALYRLSPFFFTKKFDLYWQPNFIPNPKIKAKKIVATVHDFSFILNPSWHPKDRINYFKKYFFKNIKKADHIITGSHYTKNEIIKYLDFSPEDITVIYHGVDQKIYRTYNFEELKKTKEKYHLPDDFLLFVGNIEPRKNLKNLLLAYQKMDDFFKEKVPLVLVGAKGWENLEFFNEMKRYEDYIKYIGYVSDLELAHIYNLANIFIYPSLYEGFGIPPLEAFACKTPVIASNSSAIPEVCGDGALYINPLNPDDIKEKIEALFQDKILQNQLVAKGYKRVTNFTWKNSALKHLEVFKKVLEM